MNSEWRGSTSLSTREGTEVGTESPSNLNCSSAGLTPRSSARVRDKVPSSYIGVRAAQPLGRMRHVSALLLAFSVTLLSVPAAAAPTYAVDPGVSTVRSGGYWEIGGRQGTYRVVVALFGSEHIASHVRFEWLIEGREIARTEVLHDALLGSVDVESMRWDQNGTRVVLFGDLRDGSKYKCEVLLRANGLYSKGAGC
jgi:hypothetical protein